MTNSVEGTVSATLGGLRAEIRGKIPFRFAEQHLRAAHLFRRLVARLEHVNQDQARHAFFDEIRAYTSACILSAAAALEAIANELWLAHKSEVLKAYLEGDTSKPKLSLKRIEQKPTLDKYNLALEALGAKAFEEHDPVYFAVQNLIEFRNVLIHMKPVSNDREQTLERSLRESFALSPFTSEDADFLTLRCMSAGSCTWATSNAHNFLAAFVERAGDGKLDSRVHELLELEEE